MDIKELKLEMKNLWKETFKDSSEYVDLIFDNYFHPDLLAYRKEDNVLVSALLGVPYAFRSAENGELKGLYLCGLATLPEYRKKGIMSELIEEINHKAEKAGFDFTFLIPSSEMMRPFYAFRGYFNSFYKAELHFVRGHHFISSANFMTLPYIEDSRKEVLDFLCKNSVKGTERYCFNMVHSRKDWEIVLSEAAVSGLPVFLCRDNDKIVSVAFLDTVDKDREKLRIKEIVSENEEYRNSILQGLEEFYPDRSFSVILSSGNNWQNEVNQIWSPFYVRNNPESAEYEDMSETEQPFPAEHNLHSYAMVRVVNKESFLEKIGLKDKISLQDLDDDELYHLLFRRPQGHEPDNLQSLLNLPEISIQGSLLLD